jgi:hypothetical protein
LPRSCVSGGLKSFVQVKDEGPRTKDGAAAPWCSSGRKTTASTSCATIGMAEPRVVYRIAAIASLVACITAPPFRPGNGKGNEDRAMFASQKNKQVVGLAAPPNQAIEPAAKPFVSCRARPKIVWHGVAGESAEISMPEEHNEFATQESGPNYTTTLISRQAV